MSVKVSGTVSNGFEVAREQFTANFERDGDYREVGDPRTQGLCRAVLDSAAKV